MSLNESIVEKTALEWFEELSYAIGQDSHLAPLACGAGDSIKPGVERSGTPGISQKKMASPRERAAELWFGIADLFETGHNRQRCPSEVVGTRQQRVLT
ncbi:MAG TPA: hypothetical protein VMS31_22865 [Pyrinomonadaceae bacterium]|nr:hypothetical protein [Pyrinomonadaceae bacterium]